MFTKRRLSEITPETPCMRKKIIYNNDFSIYYTKIKIQVFNFVSFVDCST